MNTKHTILFIIVILIIGGAFSWYFLTGVKHDTNGDVISSGEPGSPTFPIIEDEEESLPSPVMVPEESINPLIAPKVVHVTHNVNIVDSKFDKTSLSVKKGDTVVWTNKDEAGHLIAGTKNEFNSGVLVKDKTYSFTFNQVGTVAYKDVMFPSLTGTIIVTN
ncbi:hypothetical protein K8Q98_03125 [Candidatus Nomurabacteria bacterium]|nr:hypothetical protein [Candidatus Nomurabacteria bacterium]